METNEQESVKTQNEEKEKYRLLDYLMRQMLFLSQSKGPKPITDKNGAPYREPWRKSYHDMYDHVVRLHDEGYFTDEMYEIFMGEWRQWSCKLTDEYWEIRGYDMKDDGSMPFEDYKPEKSITERMTKLRRK